MSCIKQRSVPLAEHHCGFLAAQLLLVVMRRSNRRGARFSHHADCFLASITLRIELCIRLRRGLQHRLRVRSVGFGVSRSGCIGVLLLHRRQFHSEYVFCFDCRRLRIRLYADIVRGVLRHHIAHSRLGAERHSRELLLELLHLLVAYTCSFDCVCSCFGSCSLNCDRN